MKACIVKYREASTVAEELHKSGSIVFTNGCFDLIHIGHISYLRKAKQMGDFLWVGLNSDESVRRLKGEKRPIISQNDRVEILASLRFIDYLTIFDQDTPFELIKLIKPDILVKGADYKGKTIIGADIVNRAGGIVKLIDFVEGKSTSTIIDKIKTF